MQLFTPRFDFKSFDELKHQKISLNFIFVLASAQGQTS
jgi:hypothetical protein